MRPTAKIQLPDKLGFLLSDKARYKVLYGGRGSGKSWGIARALIVRAASEKVRILCAREIQRTIQDSVHQLIADQIQLMGLAAHFRITDHEISSITGSQFLFAGLRSQDVHKIKSFEGVDVCWVEEAHVVTKKSWETLIPTIRKENSEIWISFNPELDTDDTYIRFVADPPRECICRKVNYSDNPWFPTVLQAEMDDLRRRDPESARNVWDGECRSAVEGAIFAKQVAKLLEEKRVQNLPPDPILHVHAIWDLGWNDATSIIFVQRNRSEVRVIDYIEDSHRTLADYAQQIRDKKYLLGKMWLPHDGRSKNLQTGKSPEEVLVALGFNVSIVENMDVEQTIQAARLMFPRVYMDKTKTERLLHCLKRYRRQVNQTTNEPGGPLHDEYSHGADAFRYLAVVVERLSNTQKLAPIKYDTRGIV